MPIFSSKESVDKLIVSPGDRCVSIGPSRNIWNVVEVLPGSQTPLEGSYPGTYVPQADERRVVLQCTQGRDEGKQQTIYEGEIRQAVLAMRMMYFGKTIAE